MAQAQRSTKAHMGANLLKGLGASALVTLAGVVVFALLMQWIKPTEGLVRIVNQVLKLLSIATGVWVAVGPGGQGGLLRGALVGLGYMLLGVALYALLSRQAASASSYLADLGMGVAGGGIVGMIVSNISSR